MCNDRSDPYASRLASPAHKWRLPNSHLAALRAAGHRSGGPVPVTAIRPKARPAAIAAVFR
ncbi:hypothetical protein GCM10010398_47210 [Streptomyces fimbriatus]